MADDRIDIEFEQIVPWNGANDTGRDVRLKWQRNFERVKTSMQALEQQIEQAGDVHEQDLDRVLTQSKDYTDRQVVAGVELAVETANQYTDVQIEAVRKDMGDLDEKYLRKDRPDTAHAHITFEEGITVQGLATLMRLDVPELATIAQAVVQVLRSAKFVDGFTGEGYQIWQDIATGDWSMTLDRLTVRKVMTIYELIVQKIRSVGGMVVVSAANGKVKAVRREGGQYVLTFEDTNQFVAHDLMRCQVFSSSGLKYYWVEVQAADGEEVRVPVSEFAGVLPVAGDEVVLMGNTSNRLRQNLILISATEDGQPRFDCLDGVSTKSFEGCLKVRVGALDGISDSRFPAGLQPQGYGLYGNNCYLTGVFVLSNGKDVLTMFQITEGLIKSEMASVRHEINAKDNYLQNASFTANMLHWQYGQDIRVFTVSSRLLMLNHNLYSRKDAYAGIYDEGEKNVLRVKKSYILQLNDELQRHPEFQKEKKETLNEETGEVTGSEEGYRALSIYVSFRYRVLRPGTLSVRFVGESTTGFFDYDPLAVSMELEPTDEWQTMELEAKWSGTGDFRLDFTGDLYLYDLAVSDNRLADVEEQYRSHFELTDKRLEVAFEKIKKNTGSIEQYRSEFEMTAEQMSIDFYESIRGLDGRITEAETSITQTAEDIKLLATKKSVEDLSGTVTNHTGSFHVSADVIDALVSKYDENGNLIEGAGWLTKSDAVTLYATKKSVEDLSGTVTNHTGSFHVSADVIDALVIDTGNLKSSMSSIEQRADSINLRVEASANRNYYSTSGEIEKYNGMTASGAVQRFVTDANGTIKYNSDGSTFAAPDTANGELYNGLYLVGRNTYTGWIRFPHVIDSNGYWTVSFWIRGSQGVKVGFNMNLCDLGAIEGSNSIKCSNDNEWAFVSRTYRITNYTGSIYHFLDFENIDYAYIYLRDIKVEKSLVATPWCPADEDRLATKAEIKLFVTEDEAKNLISNATISADQINLTGHVTFNMLESGLQDTVNGKVDTTTIIDGGHIKTSLIDVDSLVAKRLSTGVDAWALTIQDGLIRDSYGTGSDTCFLYNHIKIATGEYMPCIMMKNYRESSATGGTVMRKAYIRPDGIFLLNGIQLTKYSYDGTTSMVDFDTAFPYGDGS